MKRLAARPAFPCDGFGEWPRDHLPQLALMHASTPPLTSQQAAAIETRDVSIALAAGAGCGKTFVLTQRFLSHLEPERHAEDLGKLAAITFTERAAREMRDRIREACRHRLQNCPPADVDHWLRVVRSIDSARVSTI